MTAGKNKLLRFTRMIVDEFDLSGDSRIFSSLDDFYDEVEMTGWSNTVKHYLAGGRLQTGIRGYQALMNDAAAGAFNEIKNATNHNISLNIGALAEPATGDPAYLLTSRQFGDNVSFDAGAAVLQGDFLSRAGGSLRYPWGVVLQAKTALTSTETGSAVDNGAASANGLQAMLHVIASDGGEWAFVIEESSTGSGSWTAAATFTADGSAVTSENKTVALGTAIKQYLRCVSTKASGAVTAIVTVARNYDFA